VFLCIAILAIAGARRDAGRAMDTKRADGYILRSDNKRPARLNGITYLLSLIRKHDLR
jgi:hypothetical protein